MLNVAVYVAFDESNVPPLAAEYHETGSAAVAVTESCAGPQLLAVVTVGSEGTVFTVTSKGIALLIHPGIPATA